MRRRGILLPLLRSSSSTLGIWSSGSHAKCRVVERKAHGELREHQDGVGYVHGEVGGISRRKTIIYSWLCRLLSLPSSTTNTTRVYGIASRNRSVDCCRGRSGWSASCGACGLCRRITSRLALQICRCWLLWCCCHCCWS